MPRPGGKTTWLYALLALATLVPMWTCIAGREIYFLGDTLHQHYPFQAVLSRILSLFPKDLPLWDPYLSCGSPLLADPQRHVYYPPALLYRFLPFASANGLFLSLHLFLGSAGMAFFIKDRRAGSRAAALGGIAYGMGGGPGMLLAAPPVLCAHAWLPWTAAFAARLRAVPSFGNAAALGLSFAWLALAGYPQYLLYAGLLAILLVWLLPGSSPGRLAPWLAAAAAAALLCGAACLVPFAEYLSQTSRAQGLSLAMANTGAMRFSDLLALISPFSLLPRGEDIIFGVPDKWSSMHFLGVPTLALAVTAAVMLPRDSRTRMPLIVTGTGFLLALGAGMPGIGPLLLSLPPLSWIRHAGLWMCLGEFGLAWLAAVGLDKLEGELRSVRGRAVLGGWGVTAVFLASMGAAAGIMKTWILKNWGEAAFICAERVGLLLHPAAILGWVILFLWLARRREIGVGLASLALILTTWVEVHALRVAVQPTAPAGALLRADAAESFLEGVMKKDGWFRVFVTPRHQMMRMEEGDGIREAAGNLRRSLRSNLTAAAGLFDADSDNPLQPAAVAARLDQLKAVRTPWGEETMEIFRDLGVRFLITRNPIPRSPKPPVHAGHVRIYEIPESRGPAWLEPRDSGTIMAAINPKPGRWEVLVSLNHPAHLVVSETYLKGWRVSGGKPARGGEALLGVDLPAGENKLSLRYAPLSVLAGLALSCAALLILLGWAGVAIFRSWRINNR